jgi:molybdopterin synthase catalytic subunit
VSGVRLARVSENPIDRTALLALVERTEAGAVALFLGIVRDHDPQAAGTVVALDYTAHPGAGDVIGRLAAAVLAELDPDGEAALAAVHRIGRLAVGDDAFVVAVSAPHRRLAFAVCEELVERVKRELPVWKQQFEAYGSYRWSGL